MSLWVSYTQKEKLTLIPNRHYVTISALVLLFLFSLSFSPLSVPQPPDALTLFPSFIYAPVHALLAHFAQFSCHHLTLPLPPEHLASICLHYHRPSSPFAVPDCWITFMSSDLASICFPCYLFPSWPMSACRTCSAAWLWILSVDFIWLFCDIGLSLCLFPFGLCFALYCVWPPACLIPGLYVSLCVLLKFTLLHSSACQCVQYLGPHSLLSGVPLYRIWHIRFTPF